MNHIHTEYSEYCGVFRCACGAIRTWQGEHKIWVDDGTQACAVCAQPALPGTERCEWHQLIVPA